MCTALNSSSIRRGSGMGTDYNKVLNIGPLYPCERVVTSDDNANYTDYNVKYNTRDLKRTLSDTSLDEERSSGAVIKKGKFNEDTTEKPRVLCPFYKKDPHARSHEVSCFHKGFEQMSRLKQHLNAKHGIKRSDLDFLKDRSYLQLGTIEAKWRRVYRVLFPMVSEENIPSPCEC